MSNEAQDRDAVRSGQGSTLLWTEHYGTGLTRAARLAEAVRDAAFGLALIVLAAGVAGFVTLDRPTAHSSARTAHRAL